MNTGTSRASAARKSVVICSKSGSGVHSGSADSTSVAPSRPASTALISMAAAVDDRAARGVAGHQQHRLANHADAQCRASAPSVPAMPHVAGIRRRQHRRPRHCREGIARIVIAVLGILQRVEHLCRVGDACVRGCRCGRNRCRRRSRRRRSRASPCAAGSTRRHCDWTVRGRRRGFPRRGAHHHVGADRQRRARTRAQRRRRAWCRTDWTDCRPRCCADSRASRAALCPACGGRPDRRRGRYIR